MGWDSGFPREISQWADYWQRVPLEKATHPLHRPVNLGSVPLGIQSTPPAGVGGRGLGYHPHPGAQSTPLYQENVLQETLGGGGPCRRPPTRVHACQVDYGGTAQELEAYFNHCGEIQRVTILCDKFSGHPKGSVGASGRGRVPGGRAQLCVGEHGPHLPPPCPSYAYIEFATESSAQAAVELDKSVFRGRVIKVCVPHQSLRGRRGGRALL